MAEKYGRKFRELMLGEMKETVTEGKGFIVSRIEGIKATSMDGLRKKLKKSGSRYVVVKNRLAKRALKESGITEMTGALEEKKILGLGIIKDDPVQVAKILMDFSKENPGFTVSNGYLEGQVLSAERVKELSKMPSRQQLIAMTVGMMNAPITSFVGTLSSLLRSVLYALNGVKEKKSAA